MRIEAATTANPPLSPGLEPAPPTLPLSESADHVRGERVAGQSAAIVADQGGIVRGGSRIAAQPSWQQALRDAIRDPAELCRLLDLPDMFQRRAVEAAKDFPLLVPRAYLARMRRGDPDDPLLRQVLPTDLETLEVAGFAADPVGDTEAALSHGLIKKYASRVLFVTTGACAIHCRYCFRRHFPYAGGPRSIEAWEPAFAQIEADPAIDEVILSGGDPLSLVDGLLARLADRLAEIPHVRRLRVHTRLPIVVPQRVTPELLSWLRGTRLAPLVVVHANHPAEIDAHVATALASLVDAGIPVLNQAVLLRGVNDRAEVLVELCRRLADLRVLPYYLHQLDRVAGAAHFEVDPQQGHAMLAELRAGLPGYAVPRYVREIAGEASKSELVA